MLNLDALQVLDAIARRGSFAAAAAERDRAPSAVSYSIQKLEEDVGALLFDRSGRKARLTAAGELLLHGGRQLLQQAANLGQQARALETGWESRITVAMDVIFPPSLLWPMVQRFDGAAPGTTLRLISEALGGGWEALAEGRAAICVGGRPDSTLPGVRVQEIGQSQFLYVASPDHPAVKMGLLDSHQLSRFRGIAVADTSRSNPARTIRLTHLQPTLTVSDFQSKASALEAGLGIGTLPVNIARPLLDSGRLVLLQVDTPPAPFPVYMGWRVDSAGKGLRWLIRHLPEYLTASATL